jgi:hypothetical protein
MAKSRKKPTVWVVMHYEIFPGEKVDSVQFHVASSLPAAERYVRQRGVEPFSWWQVHAYIVDHDHFWDEAPPKYYSHTGRPLKAAPLRRALSAYRRAHNKDRKTTRARKA